MKKAIREAETTLEANLGEYARLRESLERSSYKSLGLTKEPFDFNAFLKRKQECENALTEALETATRTLADALRTLGEDAQTFLMSKRARICDFERDIRIAKEDLTRTVERYRLLQQSAISTSPSLTAEDRLHNLVEEHHSLNRTQAVLNDTLEQGKEVVEALRYDRAVIHHTADTLAELSSNQLASVNSTILSIRAKLVRNLIILTVFIAVCISGLALYWLRYHDTNSAEVSSGGD